MRRSMLGPGLIGAGIFLVVLAIALPTIAYPRVAILPLDPQVTQTVHGTGFDVILPRNVDQGGTKIFRNVGVTSTVHVSADPRGPKDEGSDDAVWRTATSTSVDGHGLLEVTVEGTSLNRHTALASNCCGDYLITQAGDTRGRPMPHRGYSLQFPFDVQKRTYPLWDANIADTADATFVREEQRRGFDVYRFQQVVPDRKVGTQDLPGEMFGFDDQPSVTADAIYSTRRTFWVEPNSGALVDYRETLNRRFRYEGTEIPTIQGTLGMDAPAPGSDIEKLLTAAATGLPLLRWKLPWTLGPLGVVLLAAGIGVTRRRVRDERLDAEWDEELDRDPKTFVIM